jgi:hypothetical protein
MDARGSHATRPGASAQDVRAAEGSPAFGTIAIMKENPLRMGFSFFPAPVFLEGFWKSVPSALTSRSPKKSSLRDIPSPGASTLAIKLFLDAAFCERS